MPRRATTQPDLARAAMELVREAVFIVDLEDQRIVDANQAACELLATPRAQLIDGPWSDVQPSLGSTTQSTLGSRWMIVVAHRPADVRATAATTRDALTGLAGRDALLARGPEDRDPRATDRCGLLFIDLDGFKRVNDTRGHLVGDQVLEITAKRLSQNVRPQDLVVRYGGDEFVVLVADVRRRRDIQRLAMRIAKAIERPMLIGGGEVVISASIGVAQRGANSAGIETLIAQADRAMYRAKLQGQSTVSTDSNALGWMPRKSLIAYHTLCRTS